MLELIENKEIEALIFFITVRIIIIVVCWIFSTLACIVDFWSGTLTAKKLGEKLMSHGFRRTITKIGDYARVLMFAFMIDVLGSLLSFYVLPFATILCTLSVICIEGKSVIENSRRRKAHASKFHRRERAMRKIERVFVHCTASHQTATVNDIKAEFKRKGWKNPGYHYLIDPGGAIHQLLDESKVSNGVKGYNSTSINIAYIGGIDSSGKAIDNRTGPQKKALISLLKLLRKRYPQAEIMGHRDISPDNNHNGTVDPWERVKECPCFEAIEEYKNI